MFNTEKFEALVNKTQESSLAAAQEESPFVSAARKAGTTAKAAFANLKSKLSFSDLDPDTLLPNTQSGRSSRNKNILQEDPGWKDATTPCSKTTVAFNWLVGFVGPIIDQLNNFGDLIKNFSERLDKVEKKTPTTWDNTNELADLKSEVDELRQRSMKGNVIVTSKDRVGRNEARILGLAKKQDNEDDVHMVLRLIKQKTGIEVPLSDVQACHVLGKRDSGSYIVRFHNRKPGSAWDKLTHKIMTGNDMTADNIFINFQLTKFRANLSYKIRTAKRDKKIASYSVDQNGKICVKKDQNSEKK